MRSTRLQLFGLLGASLPVTSLACRKHVQVKAIDSSQCWEIEPIRQNISSSSAFCDGKMKVRFRLRFSEAQISQPVRQMQASWKEAVPIPVSHASHQQATLCLFDSWCACVLWRGASSAGQPLSGPTPAERHGPEHEDSIATASDNLQGSIAACRHCLVFHHRVHGIRFQGGAIAVGTEPCGCSGKSAVSTGSGCILTDCPESFDASACIVLPYAARATAAACASFRQHSCKM